MKYNKVIMLKNGIECCLRNGMECDGQAVFDNFNLTHGETDYLLTYPDENCFDVMHEMVAVVGDVVVGTAGIEAVGKKYKVRHRAEFGISVAKEFWGLGIGQALTIACIECAKVAGYAQLELNVVADNVRALSIYKKAGFVEYGRNPKGFNSRLAGFQEVIYMRLEL